MAKTRIVLLSFLVCLNVFSSDKDQEVIYGEDNRKDLYETTDPLFLELAHSTAAMVHKNKVTWNEDDQAYDIAGQTMTSWGICSTERFSDQQISANCSGFLVAPNMIVTAGHCIKSQYDCDKYRWVFDFSLQEKNANYKQVKSVYSCARIIERKLDYYSKDDYALLELTEEVSDRRPLSFRKDGKIADKTNLVVIGHPTGLPTKVADGAWVRSNDNSVYFKANLDTYGGNSGSAVFDSETGQVEGILVRGEADYVYRNGCRVSKVCENDGCYGEDVTRITNISSL